jgi:hypothetical protein
VTCNTGFKTPDCESSFVATCSASGELTGVTTCDPGAGCRRRALQSDADADTAQKTAPAAGATQLPPALRAVCSPYEVTGNRAFVRVGPQAVDGTGPIEAESTVAVTCEAGFAFGTGQWPTKAWSTDPTAPSYELSRCTNGAWTAVPTCNRSCEVGNMVPARITPLFVGESISEFRCAKGYRPAAPSAPHPTCQVDNYKETVTCSASGLLDFGCRKITCGAFEAGPPGYVTVEAEGTSNGLDVVLFGDRVRISCASCFRAAELKYYYRMCEDDCAFSCTNCLSIREDCERAACQIPYQLPEGAAIMQAPDSWSPQQPQLFCSVPGEESEESVSVQCQPGMVRNSSAVGRCENSWVVTCNNRLRLEGTDERCVAPFCAPLSDPWFSPTSPALPDASRRCPRLR